MTKSAVEWLAARELADSRSRSTMLAKAFADAVRPDDLIVDLGSGTGTNIRYLERYLSSKQKWLAIDNDSVLLEQASVRLPRDRVTFATRNLASDLQSVPSGPGVAITASAFLDITSKEWLVQLAHHCCDSPLLIAMSAASQPIWHPIDEFDEPIRLQLDTHQRADHGFGPSLGIDAVQFLAQQLRDQGCHVTLRPGNWTLDSSDDALISLMINGVMRRVQVGPNALDAHGWQQRRQDQLQSGELRLVLKHMDLLSLPSPVSGDEYVS